VRISALRWLLSSILTAAVALAPGSALAQAAKADKGVDKAPAALEVPESLAAEDVDALLARLTDAQVRQLLARQLTRDAQARTAGKKSGGLDDLLVSTRLGLEGLGDLLRARAQVVKEGWPMVSGSIATSMDKIAGGRGYPGFRRQTAVLLGLILAGLVVQWFVRRRVLGKDALVAVPAGAGLGARLGMASTRLLLELLPFAAFCLVTLGLSVLLFQPGGADRTFHVTYATGAAIVLAAAILLRFVLAPRVPGLRLLPISDAAARFVYRWLLWITGAGVFAWLTAGLLILTGVPLKAQLVISLITGSLLLVLVLAMIVRLRSIVAEAIRAQGVADSKGAATLRHLFAATWHVFAILYVLNVYLLWALSVLGQGASTVWAAVASVGIVFAFPLLDRWMRRGIEELFSGGGDEARDGAQLQDAGASNYPDYASALHRIARALLVLFLLAAMAELWGVNLFGEAGLRVRQAVLASSLDLVTAVVIAVIGWQFIKIAIDRRLAPRTVNGELVQPSQRMRTLLPLARKFVLAILVVMTVMLLLSGLGVNIGPLLAGAGVVGVAIGFGAQTLVRDILTGVFFILDDAFRVGEYIISGTYKGTVEAIGLRAVKLRHHRGSIYTVPFGELHAIQNMSRDWVIDKFSIGITYDSDIEKARKIIKKIGQTLAEDPAYAPHILEPLKMQGVEQFGDFAVEVRVKMKTRPGEQFVIRRKANAMIKQAFDENGIKFAFPTVNVADGTRAGTAAAARQLLESAKPAPEAPA